MRLTEQLVRIHEMPRRTPTQKESARQTIKTRKLEKNVWPSKIFLCELLSVLAKNMDIQDMSLLASPNYNYKIPIILAELTEKFLT